MNENATLPRAGMVDLWVAGLLMGLAMLISAGVDRLYEPYRDPRIDGSQAHYQVHHEVLFWADLGRDGLVGERVNEQNTVVELDGFYRADPWPEREVSWSIGTRDMGRVRILLPAEAVNSSVRLFLADGDGFMRITLVQSGALTEIVHSHHDGVWVDFPVTAKDVARGSKEITVQKLTGDDARVSGLVLTSNEASL